MKKKKVINTFSLFEKAVKSKLSYNILLLYFCWHLMPVIKLISEQLNILLFSSVDVHMYKLVPMPVHISFNLFFQRMQNLKLNIFTCQFHHKNVNMLAWPGVASDLGLSVLFCQIL